MIFEVADSAGASRYSRIRRFSKSSPKRWAPCFQALGPVVGVLLESLLTPVDYGIGSGPLSRWRGHITPLIELMGAGLCWWPCS